MLKSLKISDWNQFNSVKINFHPKITIITGSNGAGKSTLFRMLSSDMGWGYAEVSNPVRSENDKESSTFRAGITEERYKIGLKKSFNQRANEINELHKLNYKYERHDRYRGNDYMERPINLSTSEKKLLFDIGYLDDINQEIYEPHSYINDDYVNIGEVELENGLFSYFVPLNIEDGSYSYMSKYEPLNYLKLKNLNHRNLKEEKEFVQAVIDYIREPHSQISGLNIPSHRHPYTYEKIDSVPIHASDTNYLIRNYFESIKKRALNFPDAESPIITMKKSIISLALFSESRSFVEGNVAFKDMIHKFNDILKIMLPEHLKFRSLFIGIGEVVLETESGNFLLDAVSGGIGALIDIVWQIFIVDYDMDKYVVLIDELENHLHPSLQREILPKLIETFPKAQFVVSTHSPFVINSVYDCSVFALKYNENNKVDSHELDFNSDSGDAFEILKEVLGVSVTMPIWMERELQNTISEIENMDPSSLTLDNYNKLKDVLKEKGLSHKLPDLLNLLLENENDKVN